MDLLPAIAQLEPPFQAQHLDRVMIQLGYDEPAEGEVAAELARLEEVGLLRSRTWQFWWEISGGGASDDPLEVTMYRPTERGRVAIDALR